MRISLCLLALAGAASLAGCGGEKSSAPADRTGSGSSAAPAVAPAAAPAGVEIFVDDASIGVIPTGKLAGWPRLDTLVPDTARKLGTWELVTLDGDQAKPTEVAHPSVAFPDMVPAIFPGDAGGVSFGMFDSVELAKRGKPAMRADHLKAIHIKLAQGGSHGQNDDQGGGASDPTKLVLTVKTPAGTTTLTGDKLIALPREPSPANPEQKGWRLQAFLDAAGLKKFEHLVLTDAAGANLTLDKKDLGADTVAFIKLNKAGALRLRLYKKQGDGWNPAGDLRALVSIEAK